MRKYVSLIALLFAAVIPALADDVITRDVNQLPAAARTSIEANFPGCTISYIAIDKEFLGGPSYEVRLSNGCEVDFDKNGAWKEVDCKHVQAVPDGYVPAKILAYVKQHFPTEKIQKIDKDRRDYELELSNDLDLKFDLKGNFLRMDD